MNAGDTAMTQIAMDRLCRMWPDACMHVFTNHPDLLPHYSPRVSPLANTGRLRWLSDNPTSSRFALWQRELVKFWNRARSVHHPSTAGFLRRSRHSFRHNPQDQGSVEQFLAVMRKADLFVVAGMGGLTSAFPEYAVMILGTLALAHAYKVPTVLFGQGLGPFDQRLEKHARRVLRRVNYIALREGRHGPALLRTWNIPDKRWTVTGDDAVELGIQYRQEQAGRAIGINVRVSDYSAVSKDAVTDLRGPLQQAAASLGAPFRAVPISLLPDEDDTQQIEDLLQGYNAVERPVVGVDTPRRVAEEIRHCRIVITGSYHAGVFALAQGIPVIGLVANDYYQWKFEGLAHQFGDGCCIVRLGMSTTPATLHGMICHLWKAAPILRAALLASGDRQQHASRTAYEHVFSLIAKHPAGVRCAFQ
jgi:polysaccharide pyruvyl transferase WcaK-like protein